MGACLTADAYKDYYFIRSLSIQNAYTDLNSANPSNQIKIQIAASAFARMTYGGNATRYLGDISVQNRRYMFDKYKQFNMVKHEFLFISYLWKNWLRYGC